LLNIAKELVKHNKAQYLQKNTFCRKTSYLQKNRFWLPKQLRNLSVYHFLMTHFS